MLWFLRIKNRSQNLCARQKSLIDSNEVFIPYDELQVLDRPTIFVHRAGVYRVWISDTG